MQRPYLTIGGEKCYPTNPKMKAWRTFMRLCDQNISGDMTFVDYMDEQIKLLVLGYNHPLVTVENIMEQMDANEIAPALRDLGEYYKRITFEKLEQLPKNSAGEQSEKH